MQAEKPKNIVSVTPVEDMFMVNWRFDIRCNYDCAYCDAEWHTVEGPVKTLEQLQTAWKNIYNCVPKDKKIKLAFFGGEPTANKNFLPLVEWIYTNYGNQLGHVGFSTNGSAPAKIYQRLIAHMDWISFSIHSEFWNESHFFETVLATKQLTQGTHKRINVSIMDEPWNRHRIPTYQQWCERHDIDHKLGIIRWEHSTRSNNLIPVKNIEYEFDSTTQDQL